jgi:3-oxoacyl-[acyl-carrier protein] reductase
LSLELDDKIALVTGSSKGLGRAIAIRLAEKGVRVAVNYNTSPGSAGEVVKAITDAGGSAISVQADVANLDQVVAMVKQVEEELGAVEILVNNAGIINDQLLMRMSDEAWRQVIDINLNGTFYCTRAVLRNMVRARWGRIINIGSVVGLRGNPAQTN